MSLNYNMHERAFRRSLSICGEALTWTPPTGSPVSFRASVAPHAIAADGVDLNQGNQRPFSVSACVADFPTATFPVQGDYLVRTVGGATYRIVSVDYQPYHPVIILHCLAP